MATYYWVGGSGNWSDATNHWANASGGSPSASYLPTSADDVVFDAASNVGTGAFTVTVDGTSASPSLCRDFSTGGAGGALDGAMTLSLGATAQLDCYGSMTLPATNFTWTGTSGAVLNFKSTATGKTIITNAVSLAATTVNFNGSGGGWTLGSALTITTNPLSLIAGSFDTGGYNITVPNLIISGTSTRTFTLNNSTISLSGTTTFNATTTTNLTFNAGTSTITCSNASPTFTGGGLTYYDVTFSSASTGTTTVSGVNTFNNLTQTSRSGTGVRQLLFSNNQTISNTLTLGAANTAIRRILAYGTTVTGTGVGTAITLTVATVATLADVDFRDITVAGASSPWSGTRIGDGGGNTNITVTAGTTKYWSLAAGGNWSATAWATSSGGTPNVNNFPLAQDTIVIENTGLNTSATITIDAAWWICSLGAGTRTTAFTLAAGTTTPFFYGDVTFPSVATVTGTGSWYFPGRSTTQNITTNGVSLGCAPNFNGTTGNTVKLIDNLTTTGAVTLQQGTLNLNDKTLTGLTFTSSNSISRTIAFGTGKMVLTGINTTVYSTTTGTNLSFTGTPTVEFTGVGAVGETRTIAAAQVAAGGTASNAPNIYIKAGADIVNIGTVNRAYGTIDFTGFSGSTLTNISPQIYGSLVLSTGMTVTSGTNQWIFAATTSQTITTNGKTINNPLTFDGVGGTWACQDALTLGSTRTLTLTNGTLKLKSGVTSTVGAFATSGTNQKYLQSTLAGTQATLSNASGTNTVSYLTIQDNNATGGATWQSLVVNSNVNNGNNTGWTFYLNSYSSNVNESINSYDIIGTNVVNYAYIYESSSITDSLLSRYLWTIINNGETANWQNINNATSVWTDVNNN